MKAEDYEDRPFSIQTSGNFLYTKLVAPLKIQFVWVKFEHTCYDEDELVQTYDLDDYINQPDSKFYLVNFEIGCVFEREDWDVERNNYVYGDPGFLQGMRKMFSMSGFQYVEQLEYSDRMMQGLDFVSLRSKGPEFVREIWNARDRHVVEEGVDSETGRPETILFMYFDVVPEKTIIEPGSPDDL